MLTDDVHGSKRGESYPVLLGCNVLRKFASADVADGAERFYIQLAHASLPIRVLQPEETTLTSLLKMVNVHSGKGKGIIHPMTIKCIECFWPEDTSDVDTWLILTEDSTDFEVMEGCLAAENDRPCYHYGS